MLTTAWIYRKLLFFYPLLLGKISFFLWHWNWETATLRKVSYALLLSASATRSDFQKTMSAGFLTNICELPTRDLSSGKFLLLRVFSRYNAGTYAVLFCRFHLFPWNTYYCNIDWLLRLSFTIQACCRAVENIQNLRSLCSLDFATRFVLSVVCINLTLIMHDCKRALQA